MDTRCESSNQPSTLDNNGNTATKTDSSGITTYAWDFENRLTSVTLPGTGGTVSFKYDPYGRRIYKSSSSGTSIFAYDGAHLVEETSAVGGVVARYSHGQDMDEPLAILRGGTTSFYDADGLGSITSMSNASGALAATYSYDSFGNLTNSTGSLVNPVRYTAREFDPETNLYFYRYRYYDQTVGRFIGEDPIRFEGGTNFSQYVHNNAVNTSDPLGLRYHGLGRVPQSTRHAVQEVWSPRSRITWRSRISCPNFFTRRAWISVKRLFGGARPEGCENPP